MKKRQGSNRERMVPGKYAGSNPEAFWLRPVMAITASVQPESGRIRLPASVSAPFFFQRRHGSYCAKPTRIRSGWPGQGLAKHIWSGSKLMCRNHLVRFLAGRNRSTTSFQLLDSVLFFHRRPGWYCANPARIRFSSGWLCQVLAKRIRSGSKPVCTNHPARFWPMLRSRSGPDANRIRHVYWVHSAVMKKGQSSNSARTVYSVVMKKGLGRDTARTVYSMANKKGTE